VGEEARRVSKVRLILREILKQVERHAGVGPGHKNDITMTAIRGMVRPV